MEDHLSPAGLMGQYYAARSRHGHYRSCAITGRYFFPPHLDLNRSLKQALWKTIQRHPALCYSLTDKSESSDVHFIRLPSISWGDVVEFHTSTIPDGDEDAALSKQLGLGHEHLFHDAKKPIWKLLFVTHDKSSPEKKLIVDIAFFMHHALGDGGSGIAFHRTLLKALQEASLHSVKEAEWPFVPSTIPRPVSLEEAIGFTPQPPAQTQVQTSSSEPYAFSPPILKNYTSLTTHLTIPSHQVRSILNFCRTLSITLTGLLHSLLIIHLSKSVPHAQSFNAVTPYSMRRFTHLHVDEIGNHISLITTTWAISILEAARHAPENSPEEKEVIVRISKQFQEEIEEELSQILERGPSILNTISTISDFDGVCEEGMRNPRAHTYEISNIGVVKMPEGDDGGVRVEKMVFTQCGMVAGPAFGCSVVSLREGPLTVNLHWQDGVVGEGFMGDLRGFLEKRLLGLGR